LWADLVDVQPELRLADPVADLDDVVGHDAALDRAQELIEREQQVEQLERDLAAALRARLELEARLQERERRLSEVEARLHERERRLGELESELGAVRDELDQARRPYEASTPPSEGEECDDFQAAVGRATSYLAARRAQLREREEQRRRHAGQAQA
jgi:chromosome segregation ATPase